MVFFSEGQGGGERGLLHVDDNCLRYDLSFNVDVFSLGRRKREDEQYHYQRKTFRSFFRTYRKLPHFHRSLGKQFQSKTTFLENFHCTLTLIRSKKIIIYFLTIKLPFYVNTLVRLAQKYSCAKIGQFQRRRFLDFMNVFFSLFCYYLSMKIGRTLHLNKRESLHIKIICANLRRNLAIATGQEFQ